MSRAIKITAGLATLCGMLVVLQLTRLGIKQAVFLFAERTNFTDRLASFGAMTLLTAAILVIARVRKEELSVFPQRFGVLYIIATVVAAALYISTPIITQDSSVRAITLLVYSAVVTPVFEELIFRGFVWNRLNRLFKREWVTYVVSAILFGLWHLGYVDALAFRLDSGLANVMLWKVITGLCFGVVLGALRLKTKNCYSTMLLHGVMNIFGR